MKKILYIFSTLSIAFFLVACDTDQDNGLGQDDPEFGWLQFDSSDSSYFNEDLIAEETLQLVIPFVFTAPINSSDLSLQYSIMDVEGNSSSVVTTSGTSMISADTVEGSIILNIDLDELSNDIYQDYVFDVVMQSNDRNALMGIGDDFASKHRVSFAAPCFSTPLAGMYSVTTTYGYHDFLPSFNPNTTVVEVFEVDTNYYQVLDFSGGLYSVGPYDGAYGTGGVDNSLYFTNSCEVISWDGQSDPWGDILVDGDNLVDTMTGVFTLSWTCTGYGENGVSVYTPM